MSQVSAQDETIHVLRNTAASNNLPHLLFYGPAGTGTCYDSTDDYVTANVPLHVDYHLDYYYCNYYYYPPTTTTTTTHATTQRP